MKSITSTGTPRREIDHERSWGDRGGSWAGLGSKRGRKPAGTRSRYGNFTATSRPRLTRSPYTRPPSPRRQPAPDANALAPADARVGWAQFHDSDETQVVAPCATETAYRTKAQVGLSVSYGSHPLRNIPVSRPLEHEAVVVIDAPIAIDDFAEASSNETSEKTSTSPDDSRREFTHSIS